MNREILSTLLSIVVIWIAFLITTESGHSSVATNQNSQGIVGKKIDVSSLTSPPPTSSIREIPYLTRNASEYTILKSQSNSLQSATALQKFGGPPLVNTGSSALKIQSGGFDGLNEVSSGGVSPPDVQIAVGPNHIEEMVNIEAKIWSKSGTPISSFPLSTFYGIPSSDVISDPKILYDSLSSRWFASIADVTTSTVYFAASTSNDPTASWTVYHLSFSSNCPDQPKIGFSSDKFVISANDITNKCGFFGGNFTFAGEEYYVIDKNQMISGSNLTNFKDVGPDINNIGLDPARSLSFTSTVFLVSVDTGTNFGKLHYFTITGTASNPTIQKVDLAIQAQSVPPAAQQPGTASTIDTDGNDVLDAAWYQGKLWLSFNDGCTISGDSTKRSCLRLIQVNSTGPSVSQDSDFGASGYYYFYPALSIDGSGNLGVVFGFSSSSANAYPSLAVTGQPTSNQSNHFQIPLTLKVGSAADTSGRYGDYFAASTDPSNSTLIWVAGEYHSSSPWSTFIGSIAFNPACAPPSSGDWTISQSCTISNSTAAPANVIVQAGVVLTIPNGLRLNIDFTHHHLLVKSGGGVLFKAGGAIN